jgi:hypothetical protein
MKPFNKTTPSEHFMLSTQGDMGGTGGNWGTARGQGAPIATRLCAKVARENFWAYTRKVSKPDVTPNASKAPWANAVIFG